MIALTTNFLAFTMPVSFFIYIFCYIINNVVRGITLFEPSFFKSKLNFRR